MRATLRRLRDGDPNQLRYLLSVGLWERMAADGLLTKEELARAKRLSVERYRP